MYTRQDFRSSTFAGAIASCGSAAKYWHILDMSLLTGFCVGRILGLRFALSGVYRWNTLNLRDSLLEIGGLFWAAIP